MNTIKYFDTISNNENVPNYTIIEILKTMCKDIDMQEISLIQVNKVTDTTYSLNIQLKNGKVITSNTFELAQGPQGEPGPQGPQGPEGPAGPQGVGFNFMSEPYVGSKTPSINQNIIFIQAPSFINPVNIGDPVALIYINNSASYLCTGTITNIQGTRVRQITLSSVNPVGTDLLYGTCNVGSKPVVGGAVFASSINFNRTFKNLDSGIFFATGKSGSNVWGTYIIFGQIQFLNDSMTKMIKCNYVYDISSYTSLTNINIGDINNVSYADNTATIQTDLIFLTNDTLKATIPSNIKLPIKAGPNITVGVDETGKSIVISSPSQIKEFSSITDLYSFINQSNIEPLRLYVTLPEITGTYTTVQTDTTTNTTTVSSEDNYKYYEEYSWTILITDYTSSSLSGISFTTGASFANTFNFLDNSLNTYLYTFTYGTNLVKSNLFYGYISIPSNITFKLYYTETT